jgi:hypothetical protein
MEDFQSTLVPYQDGVFHYFMGSLFVDTTLYRQFVNKLFYLTCICLDFTHVFGLVNQYMQALEESHMLAMKAILRYLHHCPLMGLYFVEGEENILFGFSNANFAHDLDDRISTSAYMFMLSTTPISWSLKKQTTTF